MCGSANCAARSADCAAQSADCANPQIAPDTYIGGTVHVITETIPNWMAIMAYVKLNSEHFIPNDFLII